METQVFQEAPSLLDPIQPFVGFCIFGCQGESAVVQSVPIGWWLSFFGAITAITAFSTLCAAGYKPLLRIFGDRECGKKPEPRTTSPHGRNSHPETSSIQPGNTNRDPESRAWGGLSISGGGRGGKGRGKRREKGKRKEGKSAKKDRTLGEPLVRVKGFGNPMYYCYQNSVVQMLVSSSTFRDGVVDHLYFSNCRPLLSGALGLSELCSWFADRRW